MPPIDQSEAERVLIELGHDLVNQDNDLPSLIADYRIAGLGLYVLEDIRVWRGPEGKLHFSATALFYAEENFYGAPSKHLKGKLTGTFRELGGGRLIVDSHSLGKCEFYRPDSTSD